VTPERNRPHRLQSFRRLELTFEHRFTHGQRTFFEIQDRPSQRQRRKRRKRQMIVAHVERRVRLNELHRRPDGLADRARFCTRIVFEASTSHSPGSS